MAIHDLKGQIARLPEQPGVYVFLGAAGETLYVGKARVLRDRVRSYLARRRAPARASTRCCATPSALDVIVTDSVVEALALENRLIKQRNPRFNVLLRDDKTYPYLQLTTTEPAPRLLVARQVERDGNVYAGPFMPAAVARRTMSLAHRLFGIRSCNEVIDGHRGPAVPRVRHQTLPGALRRVDLHARPVPGGGRRDAAAHRGPAGRARRAPARRDVDGGRARSASSARRTCATRSGRSRRSATGAIAWSRRRMGDRDVFGAHVGPAGGLVQVFQVRRAAWSIALEFVADALASMAALDRRRLSRRLRRPRHLGACSSSTPTAPAPVEIHVPIELEADDREAIEAWLSARPERAR